MKKALLKMSQMMLAIAAFVMVFSLMGTSAKAYSRISQIAQTESSVTIGWDLESNTSYKTVKSYHVGWGLDYDTARAMAESKAYTLPANATSFTIPGLAPGNSYCVYVGYTYAYKESTYDKTRRKWVDTQTLKYTTHVSGTVKTLPGIVTGVNQEMWWRVIHSCDVKWDRQPGADGYIFKFMNENGSIIETYRTSGTSYSHRIDNKRVYKGTCQAYVDINGVRYYGPESATAYFMTQPAKKDVRELGGKIKGSTLTVNWEKVKGIKKYNVYVATSYGGNFKKVKTVSGNKTSASVKKVGGKKIKGGKTYYVYVEGIKKVGANTYTTGLLYITPVSKRGTGSVVYLTDWKKK